MSGGADAMRAIEDALYEAARTVVGDAQLATSALVDAIRDRSARYTSDRDRLAKPASPGADLAARAAFFTIADAPKIAIPIAELVSRAALPAARPLRVVDLGAGCGAMSLGAIVALELGATASAFASAHAPGDRDVMSAISIVAIDRDRDALRIAAHAIRAVATRAHATSASPTASGATASPTASDGATARPVAPAGVAITTRVDDATTAHLPSCDLVLVGTLLNELPSDAARLALVERALGAISDDGAVILVEPALRETTRALHVLRDAIIARGTGHVFAPCTRQGAPCPALADPTDWCHEHRTAKLPPRTHELARLTHLRDDGLKLSYLVLRRWPLALAEDPAAWRIVGSPWKQKGKLEVLACSNAGRVPLRLLKRHRSLENRTLEGVEKGHVVRVGATSDGDRVEITSDTRVELVYPADEP